MDLLSIVLGVLFCLAITQAIRSLVETGKSKKLPPGPTPLPVIGNLHMLGLKPHRSLTKLAKIYGPIMSLKLGGVTTVVLSSSSILREVFQNQDLAFSNRHIPDALHARDHYRLSVVWLPISAPWRSLRKILNSNVLSSARLDANQHLRSTKVQELIAFCQKNSQAGEAVDIGRAGFRTSLNLLSNTLFSQDLTDPFDQDSAKEFKEYIENIMIATGKPNLVDYFPLLTKFDPQGIRHEVSYNSGKVLEVFDKIINERLKLRKLGNKIGDVLDICLNISEENPQEIDRTLIERLFLDIFIAGNDTSSTTLEWAMAELLHNPEAMVKAGREIEQAIGKGKILEEGDLLRLPYLRCIVKETLRLHPSVPLIPRKVESDVEVSGYIVPKDAQVLINVWAVGRDPTLWEDSSAFKPERFLPSEVDFKVQGFDLVPFGVGRRTCPGLPLAVRMVPVMLGSLINCFNWKLGGGIKGNDLDMKEKQGLALHKAQPLLAVPMPISII